MKNIFKHGFAREILRFAKEFKLALVALKLRARYSAGGELTAFAILDSEEWKT